MGAERLRGAVVVLIAATSIGPAVGSANANEETATTATTAAALEAPDTADSGIRDLEPTASDAEQRRAQRELRTQRREEWWAHARAVLFSDIQLSAEQSRKVDEIIETQVDEHRRSGELQAELRATRQQADKKRSAATLAERGALRAQLKGPHECIEEMRAFLSEEQRPTFDTNRARLVAEGQQPQEKQRRRRPGAGAEAKAE